MGQVPTIGIWMHVQLTGARSEVIIPEGAGGDVIRLCITRHMNCSFTCMDQPILSLNQLHHRNFIFIFFLPLEIYEHYKKHYKLLLFFSLSSIVFLFVSPKKEQKTEKI